MLRDILSAHFAAYPAMRPEDAVKLVYQNEFGPGHMIGDERKCLARLEKEMAALPSRAGEPLYESIGGGLCRLNLRPCAARGIPPEDINRLFCDTGRSVQGDQKQFLKKLRELTAMAEADETPFLPAELDYFLILFRERGYPVLSHSDAYRAAYAPAYRVVFQKRLKDYLSAMRK